MWFSPDESSVDCKPSVIFAQDFLIDALVLQNYEATDWSGVQSEVPGNNG